MKPNNITRFLNAHKIKYTAYELPREKLGAFETAKFLAVDPSLVYKTIVILPKEGGKPLLAVIPGNREVDLKALASSAMEKKVVLASEREAERITGLQTGGISPLALLNKGFRIVIDTSAQAQESIYISGGQRGINIRISPIDLAKLCRSSFAPIAI